MLTETGGVELDMAEIRKLLRVRKISGESIADGAPVSLATRWPLTVARFQGLFAVNKGGIDSVDNIEPGSLDQKDP